MAIDEAEPPAWVKAYVSPDQLKLNRGLLWVLLIYKRRGMESSRVNVAQRLYVHTVGRDRKEANPGFKALADDLGLSDRTVEPALEDLEGEGWVVVIRRRRHPNLYRLAWPYEDVLGGPDDAEALCGRPTSKEGTCTRRTGWGTDTPGVGPCKYHRDGPQQLRLNDPVDPPVEPQPLRSKEPVEPQPLRSNPVDNSEIEPRSTATVADFDRNHCSFEPQPMRSSTATIAVEYVESALGSTSESSKPLVLAVGELTDRTARATQAPPAQPVTSLTARSVIATIRRYRDAPGWVKTRHLVPMAQRALAAGFGRDAIQRYAALVATENRYAEHQHIPELREVLRRLSRDVARGDACRPHGTPECAPCTAEPTGDRPWTEADQADLERVLDHLSHTPDQTGTDALHLPTRRNP
ncbi:hypothetical protein [Microbispora corallina]|uniref:hypothetical protein n=1 Tax=Microbispora corallina TaxID=83302 RepID=UPI00194EC9D7|nr:hypothetical protein [Microbispora corallina]